MPQHETSEGERDEGLTEGDPSGLPECSALAVEEAGARTAA